MKILLLALLAATPLLAAEAPPLRNPGNESVRNEVAAAINKGLAYLRRSNRPTVRFAIRWCRAPSPNIRR